MPRISESVLSVLLLPLCLLLPSCSGKHWLKRDWSAQTSAWPYHHGDVSATGCIPAGSFDGRLNLLWETRKSGKPAGPMTVYQGTLIYPDTRNRVRFIDVETGDERGSFKPHGAAQTGVVVADHFAYLATAPGRGQLRCYDVQSGGQRWKRSVRDAAAGIIIVEDKLVLAFTDGRLVAYRLHDGYQLWVFRADAGFVAPPSYGHGVIYQPADRGVLYAVSPSDGSPVHELTLQGALVSAVAVSSKVYATDLAGHVYAIGADSATIIWQADLQAPVWTSPAVSDDRVLVGHSGGSVVAMDAVDGTVLWQIECGSVIRASPAIAGSSAVVGTLAGDLVSISIEDGQVVSRRELGEPIATAPVTDGDRVYVATESGLIVCYGR